MLQLPEGKIESKYHQLQNVQTLSAHIGSQRWICLIWILLTIYLLGRGLFPYLPLSSRPRSRKATWSWRRYNLLANASQRWEATKIVGVLGVSTYDFFQKGSHGNSDRKTNHPFEVRIHRKKVAANWQFFIDTGCVFKECKPKSGTKFLRHFFVGSCNSITLAVRCSSRAFTKHALNGNLSQGSHWFAWTFETTTLGLI